MWVAGRAAQKAVQKVALWAVQWVAQRAASWAVLWVDVKAASRVAPRAAY